MSGWTGGDQEVGGPGMATRRVLHGCNSSWVPKVRCELLAGGMAEEGGKHW